MAIKTGTYTIADLAANAFAGTTVAEFGLENLNEAIQKDLDMHNERVQEMLRDLAEPTTQRSTIYGTNADGEMHRADEFSRGPTQKIGVGSKVEIPLDKFQYASGWTADYLRRATVQDMAKKTIASRQAHKRQLQREVKESLFGATNYTYTDRFVDGLDLAVKRLVNADSATIPNGPNGETFDGATHTHYDGIDWSAANAAQRKAALEALIQDVIEHGHGDDVRIYINRAQEADIRALADFTPLLYPNLIPGTSSNHAPGQLDIKRLDNRLIGYYEGIPVWTKPWIPANYFLCFSAGDPRKPLRFRGSTVPGQGNGALYIAGEIITHPLQSQYFESFFGLGAFTRTNGAILYLGNATYAAPTLTT